MLVTAGVRRFARRVRPLWRLVLALALLMFLWTVTIRGVDRAARGADERRIADRLLLAKAFGQSVEEWMDDGRAEAEALAGRLGASSGPAAQQVIDKHLAGGSRFAEAAVLVDQRLQVISASSSRAELVGLVRPRCTNVDASVQESSESALRDLVRAARAGRRAVLSGYLYLPGSCDDATVAAAAATSSGVLVLQGRLSDAKARMVAAALLGEESGAGSRVSLVDPSGLAVGPGADPHQPGAATRELLRTGAASARYSIGDAGVVVAAHRLAGGWSLVLEQDAAVFDVELHERPSLVVATILTLVFGVVFLLLALFDVRRQRAHRRAEVAKNAFFSVAGHELRTPLTIVKGFSETLGSRWADLDDARRQMLVEKMVVQSRRLGRLVERLLVAASIQSGTHVRTLPVPVEVDGQLAPLAERFGREAPLHTFVVEVAPDLPRVQADQKALEQVLEHIVDNAVKYSPSGGTVWMRATQRKGRIEIAVEDEGVGLPANAKRIFESFVQGESVDRRVHDEGGVGVGLFVVRTLVEEMGGTVRAEHRDPKGARFVVTLKAARARERVSA